MEQGQKARDACAWARWYDPETGRWLSNDPIGISGGLNQYRFVGNTPITYIDPFGLVDKPPACMQSYGNCFANCVEKERFNIWAVFGTSAATLGWGTMPKTAAELRGFAPKEKLNPYTGQLSRWAGRFGYKGLRDFGRTFAGRALGSATTGLLIFEGFYDIGAIGRCAVVCAHDSCAY